MVSELEDEDGNIVTDPRKILDVERSFFKNLYVQLEAVDKPELLNQTYTSSPLTRRRPLILSNGQPSKRPWNFLVLANASGT